MWGLSKEICCLKLPKRWTSFTYCLSKCILRFPTVREDNTVLNNINEIWKDVLGFEGRYMVSNLGNVKSIVTNHGKPQDKEIVKRIRSDTCNYYYVQLSRNGKSTHKAVHRLVAECFIDNPENKPIVNHIDGNKHNNAADNLEWCTYSENLEHAFSIGLRSVEDCRNRMIGKTFGKKTSQYRYVCFDKSRNRWKVSIKTYGKTVYQKRHKTELEAAIDANAALDRLGLSNYPKNIIV